MAKAFALISYIFDLKSPPLKGLTAIDIYEGSPDLLFVYLSCGSIYKASLKKEFQPWVLFSMSYLRRHTTMPECASSGFFWLWVPGI